MPAVPGAGANVRELLSAPVFWANKEAYVHVKTRAGTIHSVIRDYHFRLIETCKLRAVHTSLSGVTYLSEEVPDYPESSSGDRIDEVTDAPINCLLCVALGRP